MQEAGTAFPQTERCDYVHPNTGARGKGGIMPTRHIPIHAEDPPASGGSQADGFRDKAFFEMKLHAPHETGFESVAGIN